MVREERGEGKWDQLVGQTLMPKPNGAGMEKSGKKLHMGEICKLAHEVGMGLRGYEGRLLYGVAGWRRDAGFECRTNIRVWTCCV